jgi:hypothetical protein
MYERKISNNNYFEIQDDIVNMILIQLGEFFV